MSEFIMQGFIDRKKTENLLVFGEITAGIQPVLEISVKPCRKTRANKYYPLNYTKYLKKSKKGIIVDCR
jgi:hypothetical protein